jgi:solute carrier family 25 citrate transporter 1
MRYTVQNHGFLALYRGLTPTLISAFPKAGIRFGSNAYFKKMLMDENGKLTPGKNFMAGVGAGKLREGGREGGKEGKEGGGG